jgi:hypothetical protein
MNLLLGQVITVEIPEVDGHRNGYGAARAEVDRLPVTFDAGCCRWRSRTAL